MSASYTPSVNPKGPPDDIIFCAIPAPTSCAASNPPVLKADISLFLIPGVAGLSFFKNLKNLTGLRPSVKPTPIPNVSDANS